MLASSHSLRKTRRTPPRQGELCKACRLCRIPLHLPHGKAAVSDPVSVGQPSAIRSRSLALKDSASLPAELPTGLAFKRRGAAFVSKNGAIFAGALSGFTFTTTPMC